MSAPACTAENISRLLTGTPMDQPIAPLTLHDSLLFSGVSAYQHVKQGMRMFRHDVVEMMEEPNKAIVMQFRDNWVMCPMCSYEQGTKQCRDDYEHSERAKEDREYKESKRRKRDEYNKKRREERMEKKRGRV